MCNGSLRDLMDPVLSLSATELAEGVRSGRLDPVDVVDAFIARIEEVNPSIRAVVAERFAAARSEAVAARTAAIRGQIVGPLHGVPITVKEFVALDGMPHTGGVLHRRDERARETAPAVLRLQAAGAIVLATTNAPEGGLWHETNNVIYGRTHNPWDLYRTPGGSTGGEAALIAAGGSPLGVGSDTGGSVRIPATLCGIASFKPTGGTIPNTGHFPAGPSGNPRMMSLGPLARSQRDAWLATRLMAGPDGRDANVSAAALGAPEDVDLRSLRVFVAEPGRRPGVDRDVEAGVEAAAEALVARGAKRVPLRTTGFTTAFLAWAALLADSGDTYQATVGQGRGVWWWASLVRWCLGRPNHTGGVLLVIAGERILGALPGGVGPLVRAAHRLRASLDEELGADGVLIHPGWVSSAPVHRGMALLPPTAVGTTAVFNVTESPVAAVPVGLDRHGMPIGVQVAARRGADAVAMAAAFALEDAFGRLGPVNPRWGRRGYLLPRHGP